MDYTKTKEEHLKEIENICILKGFSKETIKAYNYHVLKTENIKHKLIIKLLYSSGLRLSELLNLKRKDIDFDRNIINVIKGKGNKDRITLLSESLKSDLLKCQDFPSSLFDWWRLCHVRENPEHAQEPQSHHSTSL